MNNKKAKQSLKILLVTALLLISISFAVSGFTVSTDRPVYTIGEPVKITTQASGDYQSYIRITSKGTRWEFHAKEITFNPKETGEYEITVLFVSSAGIKVSGAQFAVIEKQEIAIPQEAAPEIIQHEKKKRIISDLSSSVYGIKCT